MRIVVYLHLFPPEHNAGSETTVHAAMRAMVRRGHEVRVICDRSMTAPYEIDGIQVLRPPRRAQQQWLQAEARWGDVLITHLDVTSQAMALARTVNMPLVHFVHNPAQLDYWHVKSKSYDGVGGWAASCRLVVFNSQWIADFGDEDEINRRAEKLKVKRDVIVAEAKARGETIPWPGDYIVLHPVVEKEHYQCETGESVLLVNPTSGKGAATFYDLARLMPDVQFITAQGGYGIQVKCPKSESPVYHSFYDHTGTEQPCHGLPNVTHLKNDPDIRNVFRRTRVLLMPSDAESYGRAAVEACCAGIPVIVHPTEGLKEALGDAAIYCDRNDVEAWRAQLDRLLNDEVYYQQWSRRGCELAESLTPETEFDRLEAALIHTNAVWRTDEQSSNEWTSKYRWYRTVTGNLTIDRNEANGGSLVAAEGARMSDAQAQASGLKDAQSRLEAKMVSGPAENKAIIKPAKTKAA